MSARAFALILAAVALIQPPAAVHARVLIVLACGGDGLHRLIVPGDPNDPRQKEDCAKACHAIAERREKSVKARPGCC